jgi:hypothetical protein
MAIVYGTRRERSTDLGPLVPRRCGHCHAVEFWRLHYARTFFTLFWISVLPLQSPHWILCPACGTDFRLRGDGPRIAKQCLETTAKYVADQIDESEYWKTLTDAGLVRSTRNLNWDLVEVGGLGPIRWVLVLFAAIIGIALALQLVFPLLPSDFRGSEIDFKRLHPDWPLLAYWLPGIAVVVAGGALLGYVAFWLAGLPERALRGRLNAA